tara:strand:+ start:53 stop:1180 length:1128 start_codon:yes stop_codon:yes gene_type:complete
MATPNLAGASSKLNDITSNLDSLFSNVITGIENDASTVTTLLSTDITSSLSKLRALVPQKPTLPNINLQSQLTSLAGLVAGSSPHTALLNKITSDFGSALTANGHSLDKLVSSAVSAVGSATSLSNIIPNFEVAADGLSEPFEKAMASLFPEIGAVGEELSVFNSNVSFIKDITNRKTLLKKFATSTTLPVVNTGLFNPTTKGRLVTFKDLDVNMLGSNIQPNPVYNDAYGQMGMLGSGVTTNKKVSTAEDTITNTGKNRANVSSNGISNKIVKRTEFFKSAGTSITLKHQPINITSVRGYAKKYKEGKTSLKILPPNLAIKSLFDAYTVNGKKISIRNDKQTYDGHPDTGVVYVVYYSYHNNYDAEFVSDDFFA